MNIFTRIKNKIFGQRPAEEMAAREAQAQAQPTQPQFQRTGTPQGAGAAVQQQQQSVDVEQALAEIARSKGNPDLNYRTSIVDLMKLLEIDSSLDNRKELARELGYTGATDGSAEMNIWLHKAVMRQLAANGGKVPQSMLD